MITLIGGILHELWGIIRASSGDVTPGTLIFVATLGGVVAALLWRLATLIIRLAMRGLLIGVPLLALVLGVSSFSARPAPVSARAALSVVQRSGVAAYRATIVSLARATSVDFQEASGSDAATSLPSPLPDSSSSDGQSTAWVVVAHTGGDGVYLRATPRMFDRLRAWVEGTKLEVVGADTVGDGHRWMRVRDPGGQVGWVPAEFVAPLTGP